MKVAALSDHEDVDQVHAEEHALVASAQRGDRPAFAVLVERYWERLYRWLYHVTHNRHAAEDLAQETFLKAFRGLGTFRTGSNFQYAGPFTEVVLLGNVAYRAGKTITYDPQALRISDAPDANEEYLLYQTLVGAWPLEPCGPGEFARFGQRIQDYMDKAIHEAKVHSSWINPDPAYDAAIRQFIESILDEGKSKPFLDDIRAFVRRVSHFGLWNSLAQTLLKITAPGVPTSIRAANCWILAWSIPTTADWWTMSIGSTCWRSYGDGAGMAPIFWGWPEN